MKIIKNHIGNTAAVALLLGVVTLTAGCSPLTATSNSLSSGQTSAALTSGGTGKEQTISTIDPSWHVSRMDANGAASYVLDEISPDGKHVAYRANTGNDKCFAVIDNVESKPYDFLFLSPVFSPDSKSFVYSAQKAGKVILVCNGVEDKPYDWIFFEPYSRKVNGVNSTIFCDSPSCLHYLAESGNSIILVEKNIK